MPRLESFQTNFIFYMTEKQLLIADVFYISWLFIVVFSQFYLSSFKHIE